MDAGHKMDALVAEKVFGVARESLYYTVGAVEWMYTDVPMYSTDIAAAWLVVEKIHSGITNEAHDGKRRDLNYLALTVLSRYGATAASFDLGELPHDWFERIQDYPFAARGDTAPHAICLAALKAVGVLE